MIDVEVPAKGLPVFVASVQAGETWDLRADGAWTDWWIRVGPGGYSGRIFALFGIWPSHADGRILELTGVVEGERRFTFAIGEGRHQTFAADGKLYVYPNDVAGFYWNNRGTVRLTAETIATAGPIPPSHSHPGRSLWSRIKETWGVLLDTLARTRGLVFILSLVLCVSLALCLLPQGQDLMTTVAAEMPAGAAGIPQSLVLALSVTFLGFQAWFWSRRIVEANYGLHRAAWGKAEPFLVVAPRILGAIPPVAVALTLLVMRGRGIMEVGRSGPSLLPTIAITLAGLLYLVFVVFRAKLQVSLKRPKAMQVIGLVWPLVTLLLTIVLLVVVCVDPVHLAVALGPAGTVFLAAACILPVMVVIAQVGQMLRIPATLLLILLGYGSGFFNDAQHNVAAGRVPAAMTVDPRLETDAVFLKWLAHAPSRPSPTAGAPSARSVPVVIVAAEGGASRAGYWTAVALDQLQRRSGGAFSRNVFAISAVSGASVGAVGWVASLKEADHGSGPLLDFAGRDALSPALAGMLFPDLVQRFVPWAVFPDRARALEMAWEDLWREVCTGCSRPNAIRESYLKLWDADPAADPAHWRPLVLVGGASEETGRRITTSPVRLPLPEPTSDQAAAKVGSTPTFAIPTIDSADFYRVSMLDIPASTAIHNGARFPWVSPAGGVPAAPGRDAAAARSGHIVDGGYFDASGVETARELIQHLKAVVAERTDAAKANGTAPPPPIDAHLVIIRYCDARTLCAIKGDDPATLVGPARNAQDVAAPVLAVFRARGGHQAHLIHVALGDNAFATESLLLRGHRCEGLPLNWTLSGKVRRYVDQAVRGPGGLAIGDALQAIFRGVEDDAHRPVAIAPAAAVTATFRCVNGRDGP